MDKVISFQVNMDVFFQKKRVMDFLFGAVEIEVNHRKKSGCLESVLFRRLSFRAPAC
jgi:hypothetical protein